MTDTPTELPPVDPQVSAERKIARRKWLKRVALAVLAAGLAWGLWHVLIARNHVSTDNAYVNAQVVQVTPLLAASVAQVLVIETQAVNAGDLLVRLDDANTRIAIAHAEAELAAARRRFSQAVANGVALSAQVDASGSSLGQAEARLRTTEAEFDKAQIDLQRREAVVDSGAISGEELTQARRAFEVARASRDLALGGVAELKAARRVAQGRFDANDALVRGLSVETDPAVLAAQAQLDMARLDLDRTNIRAPVTGVVSRIQAQIGQRLSPGQTIMTIVPLDRVYVDANFKEGQLGRVRVGMPVVLTSDLYGSGVVYRGRVAGLSGATGSSMAVIPAQNATGNWIKTVQRLPIRIEIDPQDLRDHPLRVGLSMEVEIDVSGR